MNRRLPGNQEGTILVTALILLLVLTMLGVTAMNTTSLQEKMSANIQAIHRAFQTAESGIDMAYADADAFDLNAAVSLKTGVIGSYQAGANTTVTYLMATNPPVGSLYSASKFSAYHFDIQSVAGSSATDSGSTMSIADNAATVTLHAGAYQIGPKF